MDLLTAGLWCSDKIANVLAHHRVEEFLARHGFVKADQGGTTINNYNVHVTVNAPPAVVSSMTPELPPRIVLRRNPSPYQTVKCGSCSRYVVSLASSAYCSDECRAGTPKAVHWSLEQFPATANDDNARRMRSPTLAKT